MKTHHEFSVNLEIAYPWVGWWERNLTASVGMRLHPDDGAKIEIDAVYGESEEPVYLTPEQLAEAGRDVERQVEDDYWDYVRDAEDAAKEDAMEARYEASREDF